MRLIVGLLLVFLTVSIASAQQQNLDKIIKKEVKALSKNFQFDKTQTNTIINIQKDYHTYLLEIEHLKSKHPNIYWEKRKAVREHADSKIKKVLNPRQLRILTQQIEARNSQEKMLLQTAAKDSFKDQELYLKLSTLY